MSGGPLVSIVIPAYNHGAYLAESIDSILAQSYANLEVIVVDDGSTDCTPDVLAGFGRHIIAVRQNNAGQSAALNYGWRLSTGSVLSYVSADDLLRPGAVEAAVRAFASCPDAAFVYGDFQLIDEHSRLGRIVRAPECTLERMLTEFVTVAGPGGFFTRAAYARAGEWDVRLRQNPDVDFLFRLGLAGRFLHTGRIMAAFRVHEGSQTWQRPSAFRAEEPLLILEKFFQRSDIPHAILEGRRKALAAAHVVCARQHLRSGRWSAVGRHAARAFRTHPATAFSPRTARLLLNAFRS